MVPLAFYTVADQRFFIGAVALLNSLRITGHDEPLYLVDAGLLPEQRALLADHVTIVAAPADTPAVFLAPYGPTTHPAEVAIVLDSDIVVTRHVAELVDLTRGGRMVTFVNNFPNHDRFFEAWSPTLNLGPLRRRPYFNAGQLVIPYELTGEVLGPWVQGLRSVSYEQTWVGKSTLADPFYFGDQDVLNALAMSQLRDDRVVRLEHRLAPHPPFGGLRLDDAATLTCRYADGERPYFLHHTMAKPWLTATPASVYSTLLTRLLLAEDVTVRLDPRDVPTRLRQGRRAAIAMRGSDLKARLHAQARSQLGRFGIRTRMAARRRRKAVDHGRG